MTRAPTAETLRIDGVDAELVYPGSEAPWPAWIFVTGAHPQRRKEPIVQRVAEALARAGYLVLVPDLPGLGDGTIDRRTLAAANAVADYMLARRDVQEGRLALCGASAGASVALLAAARPAVADQISIVPAISPWADLKKMVCLATTKSYPALAGVEPYPVAGLLRRVVARSLVATLPPGRERDQLLAAAGEITREDGDPIERLVNARAAELSPEADAVIRLLANPDPSQFEELCLGLGGDTRTLFDDLSPLHVAAAIRAPVELVVPLTDPYFPSRETEALAGALGHVRLTITSTLDHTRPMLSRASARGLWRFAGFVARAMGGSR